MLNSVQLFKALNDQFSESIDDSFEPYIAEISSILFGESEPFEAVIWRSKNKRIQHLGVDYAHMAGVFL